MHGHAVSLEDMLLVLPVVRRARCKFPSSLNGACGCSNEMPVETGRDDCEFETSHVGWTEMRVVLARGTIEVVPGAA
jgi:hypothetical protein